MIFRPFTALAACAMLAAGVPQPASAAPARTTACEFVPVDGSSVHAPAPVRQHRAPAGATVFTSPDGFGGRQYMIGPSKGKCVAYAGLDQDFKQQITLPGRDTPAFEQVFGAGGDNQLQYACRYLPSIRRFAPDCTAAPRTSHVTLLDTGLPTLPAAVVRVDRATTDPQLATTGTDPVLAVVLAFDLGGDDSDPAYRAVTTSFADCRLTPATTAICVASLRNFVDEAIAFQRQAVDFAVTGDPARKIRSAVACVYCGRDPRTR